MSTAFRGSYSPELFLPPGTNQGKRYRLYYAKGVALADSELREHQEASDQFIRQLISVNFPTGSTISNIRGIQRDTGFRVVESVTDNVNNFTIQGGDGTVNGAGVLFVDGYILLLKGDIEYKNQNSTGSLTDDDYTSTIIPALTAPTGSRVDEVYVDFYFGEVSATGGSEYQDVSLIVSGVGTATANRVRQVQDVRVAQGGVLPTDGADANGIYHRYVKIATITRTTSSAITQSMIADNRKIVNTNVSYIDGIAKSIRFEDQAEIGDDTHRLSRVWMSSTIDYLNDLKFVYDDTTEMVRIKNDGKVGIGTTNPKRLLEIYSPISAGTTATVAITAANDGYSSLWFSDVDDDNVGGITYYHLDNSMSFKTNDNERIRIVSNGNVGIGITNPTVLFHVNGATIIEGNFTVNGTTTTINTEIINSDMMTINQDDDQEALIVNATNVASTHDVVTITNAGSGFSLNVFGNSILSDGNLYMSTGTISGGKSPATYPLRFSVADIERMRIDSLGNMSIGNTTPYVNSNYVSVNVNGTDGGILNFQYSGNQAGQMYGNASSFSLDTLSVKPMQFLINQVEKMRIDSNGYVGIGTVTPFSTLHVRGGNTNNLKVDNAGEQYTQLDLANNGTTKTYWYWDNINSASVFGIVSGFYTFQNGNVGIGTNPQYTFDVKSPVSNGIVLRSSSNAVRGRMIFDGLGNAGIYLLDSADVLRVVIDSNLSGVTYFNSGNVGINSAVPQMPLDINGNLRATNIYQYGRSNAANNRGWQMTLQSTGWYLGTISDDFATSERLAYNVIRSGIEIDKHIWYTNNAERMRITSSGWVGIGTDNPLHGKVMIYQPYSATGNYEMLTTSIGVNGDTSFYQYYTDASHYGLKVGKSASSAILMTLNHGSAQVGIGTEIPEDKLTVSQSSGNATLGVRSQATGHSYLKLASSTGTYESGIVFQTAGTENWELYKDIDGNFSLYNFILSRRALTVLASNGNVGINSNIPQGILDVQTNGTTTAAVAYIRPVSNASATYSQGQIWLNSPSAGDGGISYNSSDNKLHLFGYNSLTYHSTQQGGTGDVTRFFVSPSYSQLYHDGDGYLRIESSATNTPQIDISLVNTAVAGAAYGTIGVGDSQNYRNLVLQPNGGNVGIGTTNPQARLHVYDPSGVLITNSSTGSFLTVAVDATSPYLSTNNSQLRFYTSNNQKLIITDADAGSTFTKFNINSRQALATSYFGYSGSYNALVLGNPTTSSSTAFTISLGYDPRINTSGSFTGVGNELIIRTSTTLLQPFDANNGWYSPVIFDHGNVNFNGGSGYYVGIGGTNASAKFNVEGTSRLNGAVTIGGDLTVNGTTTTINTETTNTDMLTITQDDNQNALIVSQITGSSNQNVVVLNNAGTGYTLYINGPSYSTGSFLLASGTLYTTTGAISSNSGSNAVRFAINDVEKMRLHTSGYLGLNSTNPLDMLYVNEGNITINSGSSNALRFMNGGAGPYASIYRHTTSGKLFIRNDQANSIILDNGSVGIGTTVATNQLHVAGTTRISNYDNASMLYLTHGATTGNTYSEIDALIGSGGGYGDLILQSGGGKVGIGSISPVATLDIPRSSTWSNGQIIVGKINDSGNITFRRGSDGALAASIGFDSATGNNLKMTCASDLVFSAGGSDRVTILASGNVGICTATPIEMLSVFGSSPALRLQDSGNTYGFLQKTSDSMRLYDGSQYTMYWKLGNVGIGTNDPILSKLQVGSFSEQVNLRIAGGISANQSPVLSLHRYGTRECYISVGSSAESPAGNMYIGNTSGLANYNDSTLSSNADITITSIGNVGIGTNNPTSLFHVNGSSDLRGAAMFGINNYDTQVTTPAQVARFFANGVSSTYPVSSMDFYTTAGFRTGTTSLQITGWDSINGSTASRLTIMGTGNIGIGSNAPSATLDVVGNVRIQSISHSTGDFLTHSSGFVGYRTASETLSDIGAAPVSHAVNAGTYGYGDTTNAGHLRVGTGVNVASGTISVSTGSIGAAPVSHAVNASTYGYGDATNAGHLRVGSGVVISSGTISVTLSSIGAMSSTASVTAGNGMTGGGTLPTTLTWNSSGTVNYVPLWLSGGVTVGNSVIQQSGGRIGVGMSPTVYALEVFGDIYTPTGALGLGAITDPVLRLAIGGNSTSSSFGASIHNFNDSVSASAQLTFDVTHASTHSASVGISDDRGFYIWSNNAGSAGDRFNIDTSSGAVTIAKTLTISNSSSSTPLTINVNGGGAIALNNSTTGYNRIQFTDSSRQVSFGQLPSSFAYIYCESVAAIINNKKQVSFGGNVPSRALSVEGIWSSPSDGILVNNTGTSTGTYSQIEFQINPASIVKNVAVGISDTYGFYISTAVATDHGSPQALNMTSTGRIGIGTYSPETFLHVRSGAGGANGHYGQPVMLECQNGYDGPKLTFSKKVSYTKRWAIGISDSNNVAYNYLAIFEDPDPNSSFGTEVIKFLPGGNMEVSGIIAEISDERLKENIEQITDVLETIGLLRGVRFDWIDKSKGTRQIGLIAQELEKTYPELVNTDEKGFKSVVYTRVVALLIECVKEEKAKREQLEKRIEKIEKLLSI